MILTSVSMLSDSTSRSSMPTPVFVTAERIVFAVDHHKNLVNWCILEGRGKINIATLQEADWVHGVVFWDREEKVGIVIDDRADDIVAASF